VSAGRAVDDPVIPAQRSIVEFVIIGFLPDPDIWALSKQDLTGILGYDGDYEQPAKVYNRGHDS